MTPALLEVATCASSSRRAAARWSRSTTSPSTSPRREVLGVVGESGAGKSMTGAAIIGLLEPPGRIAGGEILLDGRRIDNLPYEEMRRIRGREIGMIFQDPLTSLNPLYTIGRSSRDDPPTCR
jgi:ABC-type dipeptide/oligopeptide/nickel transport system ATPase component